MALNKLCSHLKLSILSLKVDSKLFIIEFASLDSNYCSVNVLNYFANWIDILVKIDHFRESSELKNKFVG